ncbi:GNAT family N-acetyltransferase [Aquabacter spiritensis]|uniref:L-ornithine N(alpha)-acyltransferase n=1 Tax=Aquabacter spiritensis TaxID=933073 RepID=A0A4R3M5V7_9HYPH|nr:GNAT family N-acetyltransferase [Aquabacter spiritensis]TCT06867.1 ornithine-acyl[acyl carrier protein] N-acyltransferase [Aquabacter spiritensis]
MKRHNLPDPDPIRPGFNLPALVGRSIDVAKESFARFPGPFAPRFPAPSSGLDLPFAVSGIQALQGPQKLVSDLRAYSGIRHREAVPFGEPTLLGRLGPLEVRLAQTARDVRRAQRLRFNVFYEEMSAIPEGPARLARRDVDAFDTICDHLLVLDHDAGKMVLGRRKPKVVGTYRLLRQDVAQRHGGFYTQSEFDIAPIIAAHPDLRFLELGRSCVLKPYRNKRTVELLWHGIWTYILRNRIDAMFGCASLEGTDPAALDLPLSFLHHHARAPEEWRARALPKRYVPMDRMPADKINVKAAMHALPPLIKGYLRLGGYVGDGAVVDHQFGTTDVMIILPRAAISPRYVEHFGPSANRHAI